MNTPPTHLAPPPSRRAYGRSLTDFPNLSHAEKILLDQCKKGKQANISEVVPADGSDLSKVVRAGFLRFLLLGGDEQTPIHEQGVRLYGAWITGQLDLKNCFVPNGMTLSKCHFDEVIIARDAHIAGLFSLNGSFLRQGLGADRMKCDSSVFLRDGFRSSGEVRLVGAQIDGSLDCTDGLFETSKSSTSFTVERAKIKGDIFLNGKFKATGGVRILGAQIGGNLSCRGGNFSEHDGDALNLQAANIQGGFLLSGLVVPARINATSAQIGFLVDDPKAWAKGSILNGLVYQSFGGFAPTDAVHRIAWLKKQSDKDLGEDQSKQRFRPQPWRQLQKVLREMGHFADAREVGIAFEEQLRVADRIGQITEAKKAQDIFPVLRRKCLRSLHWIFGKLAGYGYRPLLLFMSLLGVWLICGLVYWCLALPPHSAIGPTDPIVFQHIKYEACTEANKGNWFLCASLPAEYTTFSPLAYSLDILLPLVDLGQEKSWGPLIPTPEQHPLVELFAFSAAHVVRFLNWFEILYGWVASLLFVAIVSGMSRRSEIDK